MSLTIPLTIDMFRVRIAEHAPAIARHWQRLDAVERERALGYVHEADRNRFVVARSTLRELVGRRSGLEPAQVRFVTNAFGKPGLAPPAALHFNTSHAGDWVLHALSADAPVGVDVELIPTEPMPPEDFEQVLAPCERQRIVSLPTLQRTPALIALWACKEAYAKACGEGLNRSLVDICIGPFEEGMGMVQDNRQFDRGASWRLAMVDVGDAYVGCVAAQGEALRLRVHDVEAPR
ncbi:MAG TPA: 4'-phosphopantetheinyl transferase superfamily protein [Albitalea sp.]|nr:4'-phosphopantetheinyl transferase superfamily protein [Albitalea sp.]